jgi:hypothetical protein
MTNSTTEIVPHGFIRGRQGHVFYDMPEHDVYHMAKMHFQMYHGPFSELSSWASSLHLVLCYAKSMPDSKNARIAVMDRQQLDGNVLIWHAPHLLGKPGKGLHEYMAHGCVRGKGYTAVPFAKVVEHGLYTIFPELRSIPVATVAELYFGYDLRNSMFADLPVHFTKEEITATKKLAALFGALSLPVKIALLNLRPRYVVDGTAEWHEQVPPMLVRFLNIETLDPHLRDEPWLRPGDVYTEGVPGRHFRDVRQWITMLRLISQYKPGQTIADQVKEDVASSVEVHTTEVITTPLEETQSRYFLRSQRKLEGKKRERLDSDDEFVPPDEEPEPGIKRARYDLRSRSGEANRKDNGEVRDKTPTAGSRARFVRVAGRGRTGLLKVDQYGNVVSRMEHP